MNFKIVENSFFARIARMVLRSTNVAMVLGTKIHLSGVDRNTFLNDKGWVAHELCHIRQFKEHGYLRFLWLYLIESIRKGYYNNKYEVEAREEGMKHRRYMSPSLKAKATGAVEPTPGPLLADEKKKH